MQLEVRHVLFSLNTRNRIGDQ